MYYNHQENKMTNQSRWNLHENKLFESALTMVAEDAGDRWEKIASFVPGKTAAEIRAHYEALVCDVHGIESGRVDHEIPSYAYDYDDDVEVTELVGNRKTEFRTSRISFGGPEVRERPRKKGTPWSKEEHRKFLEGLAKYGKGDWRSISRISVVTRTPTQVASHAQKYFNRLGASPKERKRSSIHDITITDTTMVDQPPLPPTEVGNFYNGQGVGNGASPLLPQAPSSHFYSDHGAPPPQQQQQQVGYGYQQNFVYPY